jgi:hypothetical protein
MEERRAHNAEVEGSGPSLATKPASPVGKVVEAVL